MINQGQRCAWTPHFLVQSLTFLPQNTMSWLYAIPSMSFHSKKTEGRGAVREKRLEVRKLVLKAKLCGTLDNLHASGPQAPQQTNRNLALTHLSSKRFTIILDYFSPTLSHFVSRKWDNLKILYTSQRSIFTAFKYSLPSVFVGDSCQDSLTQEHGYQNLKKLKSLI